ncbi:MAG: asparagine synthase (glutamine-hydrolyzing) [Phycisphaera sp.]|nr:asparagine synthase (glutamine-hydrolyzing) [Phycisphaera sp.]
MCGIGGILRFDGEPVDRDRLELMLRPLGCRGPDGHGVHIDGPCGLAHTRLAVLDAPGGAQPMVVDGEGGQLAVVFNGEIYNHHRLRDELASHGHRFTSDHSDTEVLLHGYRQWGDALPTKLEGMFAFAVWDAAGERLLLARDRTGKKPLFFHHADHRFTFASTLAALLAPYRSLPPINSAAVGEYLTFGYTRARTLLTNVEELPPGHYAVIEPTTVQTTDSYWTPPVTDTSSGDVDFTALLTAAVHARLEADVPLGCFLSGGIDSSIVAALAHARLQRDGQRLKTFSVSMPDAKYDEGPWAKRVADHLGTEHHALVAEPDVEDDLRMLIATMGEPLADSSLLPTYWVSKAARQHVTVALSGDGGDELFGGYERYKAMRMIARHGRWLSRLPADLLPRGEQKSRLTRLRRLIDAARQADAPRQYQSIVELFTHDQLRELGVGRHASIDDWPRPGTTHTGDELDPADAARRWDFAAYLPGDLLRKVDRASMAVALEVRCPMLDTLVVGAALSAPASKLMPGGRPKGLLRDLSRKWLPRDVVDRRKMGFAVPIGGWFARDLRPLLQRQLLDATELTELGCRRESMERMITDHASGRADHTHRLFALLSLSMWLAWLGESRARGNDE